MENKQKHSLSPYGVNFAVNIQTLRGVVYQCGCFHPFFLLILDMIIKGGVYH